MAIMMMTLVMTLMMAIKMWFFCCFSKVWWCKQCAPTLLLRSVLCLTCQCLLILLNQRIRKPSFTSSKNCEKKKWKLNWTLKLYHWKIEDKSQGSNLDVLWGWTCLEDSLRRFIPTFHHPERMWQEACRLVPSFSVHVEGNDVSIGKLSSRNLKATPQPNPRTMD